MTETLTVEIPAEVRDNSEAVTDYAFMRHRSPGRGKVSKYDRGATIALCETFPSLGYTHYQWHDVNQGDRLGRGAGQRCRFDMIVNQTGHVVYLFHTEYFTRTECAECAYSYASVYQTITDDDGGLLGPVPRCDEHARIFRRVAAGEGVTVHESEPLLIGQHD